MPEKFNDPIPTDLPRIMIENFAEVIAAELAYKAGGDIFETAENLGGRIRVGSISDLKKQSGSLVAKTLSDWTIYLSQIDMAVRDRFTIAHDIGHLVMHLPLCKKCNLHVLMRAGRYQSNSNSLQKQADWEANWFALAFLMPAEDFKTLFTEAGKATCCLRFGVSGLAVRARAQGLGLLL